MAAACRCGHPRALHDHFHAGTYCGGRAPNDEWCGCRRFESTRWAALRLRWPRRRCTCESSAVAAQRNIVLFGQFANPGRLPGWPRERALAILHLIPRGPRFISIPRQRRGERP